MQLDMKDFINRASFRVDPQFGMVASYDGKEYEVAPDGYDAVRIVGDEGETLGRLGFSDGKFVPV